LKRRLKTEKKDGRRKLKRRSTNKHPQFKTIPINFHDNSKPLLIIDSETIAYSVFYTIGQELTYQNRNTGIIYGFFKTILSLGMKFNTGNMIFCWDAGVSWRHFNYPGYKQQRQEKREQFSPEEKQAYDDFLFQKIQLNHEILPKVGLINSFCFSNFEGDDLIAKIAKSKYKGRKIIVSNDNDMFQCLNDADMYLLLKKKMFTKRDFFKKYGLEPDQWPMAKAIGGCNGDNVTGIKGVGDPKNPNSKAIKYITGQLKKGKIFERIESRKGQEIIKQNLPIVTVPYMESKLDKIENFEVKPNRIKKRKLMRQFDRFHFISFLKEDEFKQWEKIFDL